MEDWKTGSLEYFRIKLVNKLLNCISRLPVFQSSTLLEVDLDRLVKQMVLQALISKILEPEQAGCIALIDGDFQVIG